MRNHATHVPNLTSIPAEAKDAISLALVAVVAGGNSIVEIYSRLSKRLSKNGVIPPSHSEFIRWASIVREKHSTTSRQEFKLELRMIEEEILAELHPSNSNRG